MGGYKCGRQGMVRMDVFKMYYTIMVLTGLEGECSFTLR